MNEFKLELNYSEIGKQLLKSDMIMEELKKHAQGICARAGEGFAISEHKGGKTRCNVSVYAESKTAKRKAFRDNVLLKSLKG